MSKIFLPLVLLGLATINGGDGRTVPNTVDNVQRLHHLTPGELAEELSGQFEGDIILNDAQEVALRKRTGVRMPQFIWPNGIVHYEIVERDFDAAQLVAIDDAIKDIERISCVRFVLRAPGSTVQDYVRITGSDSGCFSYVGRRTGEQQLNLEPASPGSGCFRHGTILHELIHALGFYHMHSASDRDQYVAVQWQNVREGAEANFQNYGTDFITDFGVEYDYGSIMHYSATAFSKNGERTISPKVAAVSIGQRFWMSENDIWRIWKMYGCS
ncbi:seminal metalloprotease 1-like [Ochlerotatus camptorhynchus]|uniref:seminal metalloprotease 1-like n=1 Tax=Ochlerotatus camptorhynchus TaxID=644619 RepID=UPI0031E0D470